MSKSELIARFASELGIPVVTIGIEPLDLTDPELYRGTPMTGTFHGNLIQEPLPRTQGGTP